MSILAFFQAMEGVLVIILIVAIGSVLAIKGIVTEESAKIIPPLVIGVSLPAYMLWNLTNTFDAAKLSSLFYGLSVPLISMFLACLSGCLTAKLLKIPPTRKGIFSTIFFCSNTVFIGIPVNVALFGEASIPYALIYFVANACFFWTVGVYLIGRDGAISDVPLFSTASLKKILSPPMIGVIAAVVIILSGVRLPPFINSTVKYVGAMTTSLSLIFIGIILVGTKIKDVRFSADLIAILAGRFILSPLLVLLVTQFIPVPELMKKVFIIQSALPAMTQATIVAKQYGADPQYATLLTALTTVAAVLAIPIYMILING